MGSKGALKSILEQVHEPISLNTFFNEVPATDYEWFDYLGFDHEKLFAAIAEVAKKNKWDDKKTLDSIQVCVAIALKRGNIRKDQIDKTGEAGKKLINDMVTVFNIKLRNTRSARLTMLPDTLTFIRFVSIFPTVASTLIHRHPGQFVNNQLGKKFGTENLPHVLRHSSAAALIPEGPVGTLFFSLHTAYMMELSLLINPESKTLTVDELYEEQKKYGMAAWTSTLLSPTQRVKWFKTFGLEKIEVFEEVLKGTNELLKERGRGELDKEIYDNYIKKNYVVFISEEVDGGIKGDDLTVSEKPPEKKQPQKPKKSGKKSNLNDLA